MTANRERVANIGHRHIQAAQIGLVSHEVSIAASQDELSQSSEIQK